MCAKLHLRTHLCWPQSVFNRALFLGHLVLLLAGWYKDNSTDALHAWMCVIWYDRFCCRQSFSESSSFLLFIAVTGEVYVCACYVGMWVCVHVLSVCVCLCACPVSCSAGGWRHAYVCTLKLARYPIVCVLLAFMRCDSQLQGPLTLMMLHSVRDSCRN